jgi:mono/diheme cytochrome c family protein
LPSACPTRASRPADNPASPAASKFPRTILTLALLAILTAGCKPTGLPDASSPGAQVYVNKCGNCHAPYNPHELTASMWETQVTMMEVKMQAAGMPPLTSDERASILEYLKRNAGTE